MKKTIYIGGAVSGLPFEQVQAKFLKKQKELEALGHEVINPVAEVVKLGYQDAPWETIMRELLPQLCRCHELHLLPCWKQSRGADLERSTAKQLGITVVYH